MNIRTLILVTSLVLGHHSGLQSAGPLPLSKQIGRANIFLTDLNLSSESQEIPPVTFGATPAIGKSLTIDFNQASDFIIKQGFTTESLGWIPGQTLVITRKTRLIDPLELLDQLTVALLNTTHNLDGDLHLEFLREPAEIRIPDDNYEIALTRSQANGIKSRFIIPFSVLIDGEFVYQGSAALKAKIFKRVLLSSRRISRGESLNESDFYLAEQNTLSIKGVPLGIESSLLGLESKSTILKDHPILKRHTGKTPVVGRGDLVNAILTKGAMSITMKVQILDKGAPGDIVRVRNLKSKKQLKGIVTDESTIQIL
jgi:flagellar basal body P-ring formation protein FlgA